jgi:hypothetical protein
MGSIYIPGGIDARRSGPVPPPRDLSQPFRYLHARNQPWGDPRALAAYEQEQGLPAYEDSALPPPRERSAYQGMRDAYGMGSTVARSPEQDARFWAGHEQRMADIRANRTAAGLDQGPEIRMSSPTAGGYPVQGAQPQNWLPASRSPSQGAAVPVPPPGSHWDQPGAGSRQGEEAARRWAPATFPGQPQRWGGGRGQEVLQRQQQDRAAYDAANRVGGTQRRAPVQRPTQPATKVQAGPARTMPFRRRFMQSAARKQQQAKATPQHQAPQAWKNWGSVQQRPEPPVQRTMGNTTPPVRTMGNTTPPKRQLDSSVDWAE